VIGHARLLCIEVPVKDYRPYLAPRERAVLLVVAADRAQAHLVFSYIAALLDEVLLLRPLVARRTSEVIDLSNRVTIEVGTASYRTIRGRTLIGVVCDETAFWRTEDSANPARRASPRSGRA